MFTTAVVAIINKSDLAPPLEKFTRRPNVTGRTIRRKEMTSCQGASQGKKRDSRTRLASVATWGAQQGRPRVREAGPALRRSLVQVAAGAAGLGSRVQHTRRRLAVEARAGRRDAGVQFNHEG